MQESCPKRRRRRGVGAGLLVGLGLATLPAPAPAVAEGPNAIQALPGCTASTLPPGDDNSTELLPLGFTANFFGSSFSSLYVNQNGNVTFNNPLSSYTPSSFAIAEPIIAPFWADVDTSPPESGKATYGQTTVNGQPAFCVDWINVAYYRAGIDKLNSFQLLLVSRGGLSGDFDIVFNYDKVLWETGNASGGQLGLGGTSAAVGYSNGDQDPAHYFVQPGSLQNGALLDGNGSTGLIHGSRGTSQLGRYVFEVRNKPPPPTLGKDVNVVPLSGTVLVKLAPRASARGGAFGGGFVPLQQATQVPVGSVLDTRRGTVGLTSARDRQGHTQTGKFNGGVFIIRQKRRKGGLTELALRSGNFGSCARRASGGSTARASKRVIRQISAQARRGRFRTRGRYSASTVRGTIWGTKDRCDGTLTWVRRGSVVVRDIPRHRTVVVRAHHSYLAKAPGG